MTNSTTVQNEKASEFESTLKRALKNFGFLFPSTEEEVIAYERQCGSTEIIMPSELSEPHFLSAHPKTLHAIKSNSNYDNLALAARDGKGTSIPDEIRARMDKDRACSKKHKLK